VDQSTARQLVLISMLLSGGVIMYDVLKHRDSLGSDQSFRAVWSMALLFLLLAILADTVPELAGPFAAVATLAILIGRQGALSSIVGAGTGNPQQPKKTK
jgi:hypothetical protein